MGSKVLIMSTTTREVTIRVTLPEDIADRYEIKARNSLMDVEVYLAKRLADTIHYDAQNGVYLKDADRAELMQLLGRNFNTPAELLDEVRRGVTLRMYERDGVKLKDAANAVLDQTLLKRAQARADAERVTLGEWLAREAIIGLERTCGLR
jgi:hypothetical protein